MPSSELVPGDIYEVSDPNLSQFPSDGLLLSGDCIVNESMLTGKSCVQKILAESRLTLVRRRICPGVKISGNRRVAPLDGPRGTYGFP